MRITELTEHRRQGTRLTPLRARVFSHLEHHPDEVYGYRDPELARALDMKLSALGFTLWALHTEGLVGKEFVGRKVYFGSHSAIEELRHRLAAATPDPFTRARQLREKIYKRVGYINVVELLEEVREGR